MRGTGERGVLLGQMLAARATGSPSLSGARLEIDDLEHVFAPVRGAQMEIAVALAGQRAHRSRKPVGVARDALGLRNGNTRRRGPQRQQGVPRT